MTKIDRRENLNFSPTFRTSREYRLEIYQNACFTVARAYLAFRFSGAQEEAVRVFLISKNRNPSVTSRCSYSLRSCGILGVQAQIAGPPEFA